MADITPIVSLSGQLTPEASMSGKMAMPERVYFQGPPGEKGDRGEPGTSIKSIVKTGTNGLTDTYTVTLTDDSTSTFTVKNGNGIASITLQSGTHAPGTADTYKITFTSGEHTTFSVYNGLNGVGSVDTVNGKDPDDSGNVALTGADIPMSTEDETTLSAAIDEMQPLTHGLPKTQPAELLGTNLTGEIPVYVSGANKKATLEHLAYTFDYHSGSVKKVNGKSPDDSGNMEVVAANIPLVSGSQATVKSALDARQKDAVLLTAVEDVADGDYFPFYDTSEKITRKTLWSNIVTKIRSALFGTLNGFLKANGSGTLSAVSTVPVANGGTGAATASDARTNLDITPTNIGALPLSGGTITGAISKTTSGGSWISGRNNATLKNIGAPKTGSFYPIASQKTPNGSWEIGSLGDDLYFSYGADTDFNAGNNDTTRTKLTKDGAFSCASLAVGGQAYRQIYSGTASPSSSLGADGDIYVQYTN